MLQTRNVYILLFSLYWAQGLPVGFMTHALPVILRAQGVSLAQIGGFGLLMLPWFGIAAIMVGILYWMFPMMGVTTQFVTWIILSILCTLLWSSLYKPLHRHKESQS